MILDKPIDVAAIQAMSDKEKIELVKLAYAEYLHVLYEVGDEQRAILDKALKEIEHKKIEEIRTYIQTLQ